MDSIFNNAANDHSARTVSLNALRGAAMKRLGAVQQKLEGQGLSAAFTRSAPRADFLDESGFTGGLLMNMMLGGAVLGVHLHMGQPENLSEAFHHAAVMTCLEGVAMLRDQAADGHGARKLDDYPEGRRKSALDEAHACKKFNLVSGGHNNRLSFDMQADVACMYEIIDMLDDLERAGVRSIQLDRKQPVYDALRQTTRQMFGGGAIRNFARPVRMAV